MWRLCNTIKLHKTGDPVSKELASEGVFGVAVIFFELRLQSLPICDFKVGVIQDAKVIAI